MVVVACATHDSHNAFKRSLPQGFGDQDSARDLCIGAVSLRNNFYVIVTYLAEWAAQALTFTMSLDQGQKGNSERLWEALGIKGEPLKLLVELERPTGPVGRPHCQQPC